MTVGAQFAPVYLPDEDYTEDEDTYVGSLGIDYVVVDVDDFIEKVEAESSCVL